MTAVNPAHDLDRAARAGDTDPALPDRPGTVVRPAGTLPWAPLPQDGTEALVLRTDPRTGAGVSMLRFAEGSTTGLHRHAALATSWFVSGSLLDFQGPAGAGELGVNLPGATHDACARQDTLLLSRLDGPVHPVPLTAELRGPDRDDPLTPVRTDVLGPPDVNVLAAAVAWEHTRFPGVARRTLWQAGPNRAVALLRLAPGTTVPRHLHLAPLDTYVLRGAVRDDEREYAEGDYAFTGTGTRRSLRSDTGAELLVWADGPAVFAPGVVERLYMPPAAAG